jgi:hypothetical protein
MNVIAEEMMIPRKEITHFLPEEEEERDSLLEDRARRRQ